MGWERIYYVPIDYPRRIHTGRIWFFTTPQRKGWRMGWSLSWLLQQRCKDVFLPSDIKVSVDLVLCSWVVQNPRALMHDIRYTHKLPVCFTPKKTKGTSRQYGTVVGVIDIVKNIPVCTMYLGICIICIRYGTATNFTVTVTVSATIVSYEKLRGIRYVHSYP